MPNLTWSFDAAVRGYHFYRKYWRPSLSQKLDCDHEPENAFDQFAKKMFIKENGSEKIVRHLPREISRPTKFLLARGAVIHAEISSVKYRRSPLVRCGLELSCIVFVSMPPTVLNENLISRYKSLLHPYMLNRLRKRKLATLNVKNKLIFSIGSTTKTKVQTKLKRKSQEMSASGEKINLQRKNCSKVKTYRYFLLIWRNLMTKQAREKLQKTL